MKRLVQSLSLFNMLLEYKNINIKYTDFGKGEAVVLLHGFLENASMWNYLIEEIKTSHRVVSVDLLGHGSTGNLGYVHTMEEMGEAVWAVLEHLQITSFIVIGHSMGGYVALTIAKNYPESVKGLCLMNSTYRADSEERKIIRMRSIEMVRRNYNMVIRTSFLNLFAEQSKRLYVKEIENALNEALKTSVQGYVAAQRGMMEREDNFEFLKTLNCEKLIIIGSEDPVINGESIKSELFGTSIEYVEIKLGHMSHIENKTENTYKIMHFIEKIYS